MYEAVACIFAVNFFEVLMSYVFILIYYSFHCLHLFGRKERLKQCEVNLLSCEYFAYNLL